VPDPVPGGQVREQPYRLVMPPDQVAGEVFRVVVQVGQGGPVIENAGVIAPGPAEAVTAALGELAAATRVIQVSQYTGDQAGWQQVLIMAAGDAPLDEALAGLGKIARAAGIFEQTWEAGSVTEVCDMIAEWADARRPGRAGRPGGQSR
jgi:hypothetical protein